jgi:hypothetical protein
MLHLYFIKMIFKGLDDYEKKIKTTMEQVKNL